MQSFDHYVWKNTLKGKLMLRQFFSAVTHQLDMCECNGSKFNSSVTLSVFRSVSDGVVDAMLCSAAIDEGKREARIISSGS